MLGRTIRVGWIFAVIAATICCGAPQRSCPPPQCNPEPMPRCSTVTPIDVANALGQQTGQRVMVRGRVAQAWVTCELIGPCGRCNGGLSLTQDGVVGYLELRGQHLGCQGPEGHMCCDVDAIGKDAIATGTLRQDKTGTWLADATLCAP